MKGYKILETVIFEQQELENESNELIRVILDNPEEEVSNDSYERTLSITPWTVNGFPIWGIIKMHKTNKGYIIERPGSNIRSGSVYLPTLVEVPDNKIYLVEKFFDQ